MIHLPGVGEGRPSLTETKQWPCNEIASATIHPSSKRKRNKRIALSGKRTDDLDQSIVTERCIAIIVKSGNKRSHDRLDCRPSHCSRKPEVQLSEECAPSCNSELWRRENTLADTDIVLNVRILRLSWLSQAKTSSRIDRRPAVLEALDSRESPASTRVVQSLWISTKLDQVGDPWSNSEDLDVWSLMKRLLNLKLESPHEDRPLESAVLR